MIDSKKIQNLSSQLDSYHKQIIADAKKAVDLPPPELRFTSINLIEEKSALETEEGLISLQNLIDKGLNAIFISLQEQGKEEKIKNIIDWFEAHEDEVVHLLEKGEALFSHKETINLEKNQLDLPKDILEVMYQASVYHFSKEKYEDALSSILICLFFNGTVYDLWLMFGNILHKKGNHEEALYGYQTAFLFRDDDPKLYIHMALAWISLQSLENAELTLIEALKKCQDHMEYKDLSDYCHTLQEWLNNKKING